MKICRVEGTVVATVKHPAFAGQKLMIVQPLDEKSAPKGTSFLAVDTVQSGAGDRVLVLTEGNGSRQILKLGAIVPVRSVIVGIIDNIDVEPEGGAA